MSRIWVEELEKHQEFFSVCQGVSMWPMLRNRQDIVEIRTLDRPARRYDVVLYTRGKDQGVLHRVLHVRDRDDVIAGDNCWQKEYIPKDRLDGIAIRFYRKGTWYEMTDWRYRIYVHLWTDLFFLRRPVFYLRDRMKGAAGRIRRSIRNRK